VHSGGVQSIITLSGYSQSTFSPFGMVISTTTSESYIASEMNYSPLYLESLSVKIPFNTSTSTNSVKTRIAGANGNMTATIPATTTGEFTDSANTDVPTLSSKINYSCNINLGAVQRIDIANLSVVSFSRLTALKDLIGRGFIPVKR